MRTGPATSRIQNRRGRVNEGPQLWLRGRTREAKGYAALEQRIIGSHEKNVRDGGYRFRAAPGAQLLRNVVTFNWEMFPASAPEQVAAVGLEFIIMDDQGRALTDYQFIIA